MADSHSAGLASRVVIGRGDRWSSSLVCGRFLMGVMTRSRDGGEPASRGVAAAAVDGVGQHVGSASPRRCNSGTSICRSISFMNLRPSLQKLAATAQR